MLKKIAEHALTAATTHIAKVDADHDRIEWLEKNQHELERVYRRVENNDGDGTVREAIDHVRKGAPTTETADA